MFWTEKNLKLKDYNKMLFIQEALSTLSTMGFTTEQRDFVEQRKTECNRHAEEVFVNHTFLRC